MIPRNTLLPSTAKQRFVTVLGNPRSIHVKLLEGEATETDACTFIGDFRIVNLPTNLPVGSPVEVEFGYDVDGRIRVSMKELTGNNEASIEIAWNSGIDHAAMESFRKLAKEYQVQ